MYNGYLCHSTKERWETVKTAKTGGDIEVVLTKLKLDWVDKGKSSWMGVLSELGNLLGSEDNSKVEI